MLKILHNPRCSKSRETLKLIQESNTEVEIIEYLKNTPSKDELQTILTKLNIKAEALLRKNEAIFKENYKGKTFTNEEWIEIMVANPKLIERPIVIKGKQAVIGRPPQNVISLLD